MCWHFSHHWQWTGVVTWFKRKCNSNLRSLILNSRACSEIYLKRSHCDPPIRCLWTWSSLLTSQSMCLLKKIQWSYLFTSRSILGKVINQFAIIWEPRCPISRKTSLLIIWSCCNSIVAAESSLKPLQIRKCLLEIPPSIAMGFACSHCAPNNPHQYYVHMHHLSLTLILRHRQTYSAGRPISRAKSSFQWEKTISPCVL